MAALRQRRDAEKPLRPGQDFLSPGRGVVPAKASVPVARFGYAGIDRVRRDAVLVTVRLA
jgi:hypothetical protein